MKKIRLKSRHKKTSLTCQRSRLLDLVDKNALKKLLNAFSNATGLRANIVDVEGKSIFGMADAQKKLQILPIDLAAATWRGKVPGSRRLCS
ncbi:MAG: PocR ligand-binding domain-containing protein [Bacillota bacterium]|jgi:hypothetical protein